MKPALLGCLIVLASCTQTVKNTAKPADLFQLQQRVDADYIAPFKAGDVERWLMVFTDDVVGLHNRMPAMEGKEGLRGFGSFVAQNLTVPEMSVNLTGIRQEGDLAYTWGTYRSRLLMRASGESLPGHRGEGKVLFVWKRQPDGTWKIAVDMGNDLPAPGGA
ncbi:MAG: nuclear transport factor 2 family protein [Sphingomonadales bacterium]|jgi:ketosteroid isomerase-like protein|nr:nuclear transport factor 2 family protein [Sphingomonadales bacterium]